MKKLSVVGKDYHTEENVIGYYNTGDRMATWGKSGLFWGWIWGLLFGSAFFIIQYETALKVDKFILIVHGTPQEVEKARGILMQNRAEEANVHDVTISQ